MDTTKLIYELNATPNTINAGYIINLWNEYVMAVGLYEAYIYKDLTELLEELEDKHTVLYAVHGGSFQLDNDYYWLDKYKQIQGTCWFKFTPIARGLRGMIAWYADNGRLDEVEALLD